MKIVYEKQAIKYLKTLSKPDRDRIREAISRLPEGDVKPLQGYKDGRLRLRVGKYRVIYRIENDNTISIVFVMDIGSRGDIYK